MERLSGRLSQHPNPQCAVLLVDDEEALLRAMALVLRKEPYRVMTACSASLGLAILRGTPVTVVVSDERMPGMRGSEFLARVRSECPHIIRIMLTAEANLGTTAHAIRSCEPYRFLCKPVDPVELRRVLRQACTMEELASQGAVFRRRAAGTA
jgi:two-component system, probable response regulator PhcQ